MKLKTKNCIFAMSFVACFILTGCGGGSDSPAASVVPTTPPASFIPTAPATTTAEGVYAGDLTGSSSKDFELLVLENGEFWSIYGTSTSSTFGIAGFVQGSGNSTNGKFTSNNAKDFGVNPVIASMVNANYDVSKKTIAGTVTGGNGNVIFSGGPIDASLFNYSTPASLSTIVGSWSTHSMNGEGIALNISANGTFNATSDLGCKFNGSVAPRSSGKNVFNVALIFGIAPCALPGQSATGIALAYPFTNGKTQLLVTTTDSTRSNGAAVFGVRTSVAAFATPTTTTTPSPTTTPSTSTTTTTTTTPTPTVPVSTGSSSSSSTCYVGPRGGTYTLTANGYKNYGGC